MAGRDTTEAPATSVPSWPRALGQGIAGGVRFTLGRGGEDVDGSVRTVSIAFIGNLIVALAKYAGFFVVHSSALLAESVHSTAVTINQGLMLRGHLTARYPATREHQFGFGQARYFWAFVVSVVIFGIGAVISIGRGALALAGPAHGIERPAIPLAALTVGLIMDGWSFVVAVKQSRAEKGSLSYRQYVARSKNPEVPVVLLEDTAALIGLLFAYAGITLAVITGNAVYDAVASILIGLLLASISFTLAREMRSLLIGESATAEEEDEIRAVLTGHGHTRGVVYFRTLYLGPTDLLVEAKVAFDRDLRFSEIATAIDEMESGIRARAGNARVVTIEPGVAEPGDVDTPSYQQDGPGNG